MLVKLYILSFGLSGQGLRPMLGLFCCLFPIAENHSLFVLVTTNRLRNEEKFKFSSCRKNSNVRLTTVWDLSHFRFFFSLPVGSTGQEVKRNISNGRWPKMVLKWF